MRFIRFLPAIVTIAAILSACSSGSHSAPKTAVAYDPQASTALNVARSMGIDGLSDVPKAAQAVGRGFASGQPLPGHALADDMGGAGQAINSAVSPPQGISGAGAGALSAISLLTQGKDVPARNQVFIDAWVPTSLAASQADAQIAADHAVAAAWSAVMFKTRGLVEKSIIDVRGDQLGSAQSSLLMATPDCQGAGPSLDQTCRGTMTAKVFANDWSSAGVSVSPPFVAEGGRAYGPYRIQVYVGDLFKKVRQDRQLMQLLSQQLPEWIYIYLPPTQADPPMVLRHGEVLKFLSP